jgi:hypothetical protein
MHDLSRLTRLGSESSTPELRTLSSAVSLSTQSLMTHLASTRFSYRIESSTHSLNTKKFNKNCFLIDSHNLALPAPNQIVLHHPIPPPTQYLDSATSHVRLCFNQRRPSLRTQGLSNQKDGGTGGNSTLQASVGADSYKGCSAEPRAGCVQTPPWGLRPSHDCIYCRDVFWGLK